MTDWPELRGTWDLPAALYSDTDHEIRTLRKHGFNPPSTWPWLANQQERVWDLIDVPAFHGPRDYVES